ncbi:M16 family metallopeptidase [Massilia sp. GCM10020059]|uniref:Insulinase family protein n=1 Tax=Massilia agrisoli TaxID=2892444 RepID=A0ABS8IUE9_9BURK|nr:pitrilysin family protein [Massilia agrisoli]MCC6071798.1 insulinase family protein [Massilia agrisoli]
MKKLMLALTITLMFAPSAYAAGADSKAANTLPPFGKEKTIPAPQIAKKVLSNGLEVWVVPRKGLPRVDYVLAVRDSGLAADDKNHPGFAKLLAGLLNEGSTKRDSRAIAELAQSYGGSVAASPGNDGITVFANAVTSNAGPMMNLLAEVARMPSFPAKEVELAKANALQALRVSETTPRFRAERAISKAIYGDHPYGNTTETAESISSTTEELLRTEHAKRFRPERSLLVITGRISQADAMKFAQAAFGDWKGQGAAAPATPAFTASAKPVRILLQRDGSVQSTLRLGGPGIPATSADYVPLRLASTILGGGFSSRVNTNLREEKGYTYGASAGARTMRTGGGIVGGADVRNEVTGAALTEYFGEYRRLGGDLVPADEMSMNKRYVAGTYLITNQLQRAVASTLANNWLVGLPSEFLGEFVPAIQKVTPEQVRDMGKKYFAPETQSIVVVGDNASVSTQLKQFGDFTVTDK